MTELPPLEQPCGGPALSVLRRYDTAELAGPDHDRVSTHLDGCEACRALVREFVAERRAVALAVPFSALEARAGGSRVLPWWRRVALWLALPAAGVAAALVLVPRGPPAGEVDGIRIKGTPTALEYLVRTDRGSRLGHDDEPLKAGDMIRLRYNNEHRLPFVLIVGVDADGKVFAYHAEHDRSARALAGLNLVGNAVTLDGDPRPERIFALFSQEALAVDEVRPAARDALAAARGDVTKVRRLPVPAAEQATLLLTKAGP